MIEFTQGWSFVCLITTVIVPALIASYFDSKKTKDFTISLYTVGTGVAFIDMIIVFTSTALLQSAGFIKFY